MQLYTFGVWFGDSLYYFRKQYPEAMLLNFDSFVGLPAEQSGEVRRTNWNAGAFGPRTGLTKPIEVMSRLYDDLGGADNKTMTVRGFYNDSLTPELASQMLPAAIVDVDSDIYISAVQALDWLFANKLVRVGTIVSYDDWMDYACTLRKEGAKLVVPGIFDGGEPKAHYEIASKYSVDFRCLAGACAPPTQKKACDMHAGPFGALFVVASIGSKVNHGFEMDRAQLEDYAHRNAWCRRLRKRHRTFT